MIKVLLLMMMVANAQIDSVEFGDLFKPSIKINAHNQRSRSLLIDENCRACTKLISKLKKSCSSFDQNFKVLASGSKKNLVSKLYPLTKKKVSVFTNPEAQNFLKLGVSSLPTYIGSNNKLTEGDHSAFKAILKDEVCLN